MNPFDIFCAVIGALSLLGLLAAVVLAIVCFFLSRRKPPVISPRVPRSGL